MIILKCAKCGKMVFVEKKSGCPTMCCGQEMEELIPGAVDASKEKHVPVLTARGNKVQVTVGSAEHPMLDEHYIQFIILETSHGYQLRRLNPAEAPKADFLLSEGESAVAAYEYCNLHGLWKAELKQDK
jgi:superoxide reductase